MQIHFYKDIFTAFAIIIIKLPNARKWTGGGEAWAQLKIDWCI